MTAAVFHKLDLKAPIKRLHVMAAGPSGAGKTHFCATFPQPVVIGATMERGGITVAEMDRSWWYEPGVEPAVYEVRDHYGALAIIEMVEKGQLPCKTLALELTFYAKSVLASVAGSFKDPRQAYGFLMTHLELLVTRMHAMPRHIVLTAISTEDGSAAVAIPGQSGANLPALVDIWLQLESSPGADGETEFVAHTRPTERYKARSRYGSKLPAKIVPRYLDLEHYLKLTPMRGNQQQLKGR